MRRIDNFAVRNVEMNPIRTPPFKEKSGVCLAEQKNLKLVRNSFSSSKLSVSNVSTKKKSKPNVLTKLANFFLLSRLIMLLMLNNKKVKLLENEFGDSEHSIIAFFTYNSMFLFLNSDF